MSVALQKYIKGRGSVQIARGIETAVREGALGPGARLPTVRALAERLSVSPTTVNAAYRILRQRGVTGGRGRAGTRIAALPPIAGPVAAPLPAGVHDLADGNPDPELLPDLGPALHALSPQRRLYGRALKSGRLLRLAAKRLGEDGVPAGSLAVVNGALDGIERVLSVHLRAGDRVVVEDPAFVGVTDLLAGLGLQAVPAAIDESGLLPDMLEAALATGAEALVVTPRAQNPTGAVTDTARAKELGRVLRRHPDLLVIEDDHAAGVAGTGLATLVDPQRSRWAFARSVSKSLGPDLRLAILAGDESTIARVEGRQLIGMRWVSHVLQDLVAALWSDRSVARRLTQAEKIYAKRRAALRDALAAHDIASRGKSGLNIWIPVDEEAAVVQALRDLGWAVVAGERFRLRSRPGIRVTTARLDPNDALRFAEDLSRVLQPRQRRAAV